MKDEEYKQNICTILTNIEEDLYIIASNLDKKNNTDLSINATLVQTNNKLDELNKIEHFKANIMNNIFENMGNNVN